MATTKVYARAQQAFANKEIDWDTNTAKVLLCSSSYTPSQTTHDYKNDITNEVTGTGYVAGGVALSSKTTATSSLVTTLDAADPSFGTVTVTFRYAIVYIDTGVSSTSPLLCYVDFVTDQTVTAAVLVLQLNASGLLTFTTP